MMITMTRIKMNSAISKIRAFTLLESLLVLLIVSFITLFFSAELTQTVHLFKGELFVLQFENLYKISQENAALQSSSENLESKNGKLIYENKEIDIPKEVEMAEFLIKFDTGAKVMFLRMVILGKRLKCWNTITICWRTLSIFTLGSVMTVFSKVMVPAVGVSSRLRQRRKVDLPDPEGPITTTFSPGLSQ